MRSLYFPSYLWILWRLLGDANDVSDTSRIATKHIVDLLVGKLAKLFRQRFGWEESSVFRHDVSDAHSRR